MVGRVKADAMRLKVDRDGGGLVMPGVPDTPAGWDTVSAGTNRS
jgi:hypothetical protein